MNAPLLRQESRLPHHASRIPLYVPARTKPHLRECWVVNLSVTGLALVGTPEEGTAALSQGAPLEVDFHLPRTSEEVRVSGTVAWSEAAAKALDGPPRVWMGVAFAGLAPSTQGLLAQHIAAYRPRVVLAFASPDEVRESEPLQNDYLVSHVATVQELRESLSRGDASVVAIFGPEAQALSAVEEVAGGERRWTLQQRPAVLYCAPGEPGQLLKLHNEGKLFESLDPPLDIGVLAAAVRQAAEDHAARSELRRASLMLEREQLRPLSGPARATRRPAAPTPGTTDIVYVSEAMKSVMGLVGIIAPQKLPVMLLGETGTGKELVARSIHGLSERSREAFVVQDCGVLAETLLESELFGHVKGAFTGAVADHPGLFRLADRGTVVLDEIENTTPSLQAKLLRVIEAGEVRPVGGARAMIVDVRVVAASNRNLRAEVDAGRFRADLYYRLNAFPIELPALRDRREDIVPLAELFLRRATLSLGRRVLGFTTEAAQLLNAYDWRGNVRELRNVVERAVLLAPVGKRVRAVDLPEALQHAAPSARGRGSQHQGSLKDRVTAFEREVIRAALERNGGVLRRTALELQTNPMTLGRRARQLGLWPPPSGAGDSQTAPTIERLASMARGR